MKLVPFYIEIFITYLRLKLKIGSPSLINIWNLDFFLFSKRNQIKILERNSDFFLIQYKLNNPKKFIIRHRPSSDLSVFKSVILEKQYANDDYFLNDFVIIDAGANVGYTTIFYKDIFPNAKIIAIEPDKNNFLIAKKNLEINDLYDVEIINSALWYCEESLSLDFSFRDSREHSVRTIEKNNSNKVNINAVTLSWVKENYNLKSIDILKMDIEGAEREIFSKDKLLLEILGLTRNIVIEIHDEFECRENILNILYKSNFEIKNIGELTFGIKSSIQV